MRYLIGIGFSFVWLATVVAQLAPPAQAAVDAYKAAVAAVAVKPRGQGIESALKAFHAMADALTRGDLLEKLTEAQFADVRRLKGVVVSRDEVIYVEPDVDYFGSLARTHGDPADRAFFVALKRTYPASAFPAYLQQQTDVGGCTRFGSLSVVAAYVRWAAFLQRFPGRYRDDALEEQHKALEELTGSTCACGELPSVERELEHFLRTVHQATPHAAVEKRLQAVRGGQSGMRAHCVGGQ